MESCPNQGKINTDLLQFRQDVNIGIISGQNSKIQSLKHGIPKGDKRKKKEVAAEIARLEAELTEKHEKELAELRNAHEEVEILGNHLDATCTLATDADDKFPRMSKAQKRRDKKANKEKKREESIAEQEIANLTGIRSTEAQKIKMILLERGLAIYEIPSDGDCLYKTVEHQLAVSKLKQTTVKKLREETAAYMQSHIDDFLPFLIDAKTGDLMTKEQFDDYCREITNTSAWGGQIEIQALSHVCKTAVEVIQAEGPSIVTGEDYLPNKLILSYHRYAYGLGEHYNSVIKKELVADQSEDNL